jgi:hypothetical protein
MVNGINPLSQPTSSWPTGLRQDVTPKVQTTLDRNDEGMRAPAPQQLLNQQILDRLNEVLSAKGAGPIQDQDPADFTPDKVANRILSFIDAALKRAEANGADTETLAQMREQAREGVERGYQQAREILEGYGLLENENIEKGIAQTYDLLQQGLDRMDRGEALVAPAEVSSPAVAEMFAAQSRSEERTLSLDIETRDGDKISIDLSRYQSSSSHAYLSADAEGVRALRLDKTSSGFSFEYRVQGELDAEEEAAIKALLAKIDGLADDFFAGKDGLDLEALSAAFDTQELVGFDLSMQQIQTRSATLAYQEVGRLPADEAKAATEAEWLAPGRLLQEVRDMLEDFRNSDLFRNPAEAFRELLSQRLDQEPRLKLDPDDDQVSTKKFVEKLLNTAGVESPSSPEKAD